MSDEEEPLAADRVVRRADGSIALRLVEREREILRALVEDLAHVVSAPPLPAEPWDADGRRSAAGAEDWPGDPAVAAEDALASGIAHPGDAAAADDGDEPDGDDIDTADIRARLYPSAAPEDPHADASYRRLVHEDLEAGRRARISVVEATLDARSLDDEQAAAWLQTLNDLRLVLGTRLGVSEDSESEAVDPEDPEASARILYAYTGWLEGQFVDVLAAALPDLPEPHDAAGSADVDESVREDDS